MFIKKKKSFIYFPNRSRFFDFSINFSSQIFNYANPTFSKRIKNNLKKKNYLFYTRMCDGLDFKSLTHIYPQLANYDFFLIDNQELIFFFLNNHFDLLMDPLEKDQDRFLCLLDGKIKNSKKISYFLVSDLFLNFNLKTAKIKLANSSGQNVLYLNSTFPNFDLLQKVNSFPLILVGGNHPLGLNQKKLILIKKGEKKNNFNLSNGVEDYFLYKEIIQYYRIKRDSNQVKKVIKVVQKRLVELQAIKRVRNILVADSNHLLLFKIILVDDHGFKDKLNGKPFLSSFLNLYPEWKNRIFIKDLTFYYKQNTIYIHLPLTIPLNHLMNKFKRLADFLS